MKVTKRSRKCPEPQTDWFTASYLLQWPVLMAPPEKSEDHQTLYKASWAQIISSASLVNGGWRSLKLTLTSASISTTQAEGHQNLHTTPKKNEFLAKMGDPSDQIIDLCWYIHEIRWNSSENVTTPKETHVPCKNGGFVSFVVPKEGPEIWHLKMTVPLCLDLLDLCIT